MLREERVHGYRADVAFDGERSVAGGLLVLVDDGVIVGVEPGAAAAPADCPVLHRPGATMLPGLIDAHTHLCGDNGATALERLPELSRPDVDATIEAALRAQLAAGVTAVRDLGDQDWAVVDRHLDRAEGPTIVASGPPLTVPGGHCAAMGGAVSGVGALRAAVRERAERGASVVKIMTSGGFMTESTDVLACQFSLDEVRAVVDEAHRLGLPVAAHAHPLAAVALAVDAGVDTIEHCTCLTAAGLHTPPELADAIARAGIVVCPTLGNSLPPLDELPSRLRELAVRMRPMLGARVDQVGVLVRGGVTLVSGVDSGINPAKPHGLLPVAVGALVDCGMSTVDALASATSVAARACSLADRTGRLAVGLDADLLLVDGDPIRDISALRRPVTVVSRGREVDLS
jgi:imidazolonepropionase-like amidohydrolase